MNTDDLISRSLVGMALMNPGAIGLIRTAVALRLRDRAERLRQEADRQRSTASNAMLRKASAFELAAVEIESWAP